MTPIKGGTLFIAMHLSHDVPAKPPALMGASPAEPTRDVRGSVLLEGNEDGRDARGGAFFSPPSFLLENR